MDMFYGNVAVQISICTAESGWGSCSSKVLHTRYIDSSQKQQQMIKNIVGDTRHNKTRTLCEWLWMLCTAQ